MPWGNARSLTRTRPTRMVAFLLNLNDIVKDDFELNDGNSPRSRCRTRRRFFADDRETSEKKFWNRNPCMKNCRALPKVTGRASETNVTPDGKSGPKVD